MRFPIEKSPEVALWETFWRTGATWGQAMDGVPASEPQTVPTMLVSGLWDQEGAAAAAVLSQVIDMTTSDVSAEEKSCSGYTISPHPIDHWERNRV